MENPEKDFVIQLEKYTQKAAQFFEQLEKADVAIATFEVKDILNDLKFTKQCLDKLSVCLEHKTDPKMKADGIQCVSLIIKDLFFIQNRLEILLTAALGVDVQTEKTKNQFPEG